MNIGLIVEGDDDAAVYCMLAQRSEPGIQRVHKRVCGGRLRLVHKFLTFLKEFDRNPAAFELRKVVVIRDSDCCDPGPLVTSLRAELDRSGFLPRFTVEFHATSCEVETWLLADEGAINRVSRLRGGIGGALPIEDPLEGRRDAKQLYSRMLSQAGLLDTSVVMREVSEQADLARIAQRCPGFRAFLRKIQDC